MLEVIIISNLMGKKGLSLEEKRQRILAIYYENRTVFNLKEIEKIGAKKGVVFQTIKDVNQSLVDDNMVETDRIGAGAFFWAFPSKGLSTRQNLTQNLEQGNDKLRLQIEELKQKVAEEKAKRADPDGSREANLKRLQELRKEAEVVKTELKAFERSDPKLLERFQAKRKVCQEAHVRWTDNLFQIEGFIKKNQPGMDMDQFHQMFPILADLDYFQPPES